MAQDRHLRLNVAVATMLFLAQPACGPKTYPRSASPFAQPHQVTRTDPQSEPSTGTNATLPKDAPPLSTRGNRAPCEAEQDSEQRKLKNLLNPKLRLMGRVFIPHADYAAIMFPVVNWKILESSITPRQEEIGTIHSSSNYYFINRKETPPICLTGESIKLTGTTYYDNEKFNKRILVSEILGQGRFIIKDKKIGIQSFSMKDGSLMIPSALDIVVGHINISGQYYIHVQQHNAYGFLRDNLAGKSELLLVRKLFGRVVEKIHITSKNINASLELNGVRYAVQKGTILQAKSPVGWAAAILHYQGDARSAEDEVIRFSVRDQDGSEHSGDFFQSASDIAERSVLEMNGRHLVFANKKWEWPGYKVYDRTRKYIKGFARYGGGRLAVILENLRSEKGLSISRTEIDLMQRIANVESDRMTHGINSWDDMYMSFGFMQYPIGSNQLQELIAINPSAFKRYGIELDEKRTYNIKGERVQAIKGVAHPKDLRSDYWAAKFFQAGTDPEVIEAEVKLTQKEIRTKIQTQFFDKLPHKDSSIEKAIIFELHNNRPAYVKKVLNRALADIPAGGSISEADFIKLLARRVREIYIEEEHDMTKGNWTKKVLNP